jgi:hypothetical protein
MIWNLIFRHLSLLLYQLSYHSQIMYKLHSKSFFNSVYHSEMKKAPPAMCEIAMQVKNLIKFFQPQNINHFHSYLFPYF